MGGHGDIHQKDSSHEITVSISHWNGAELRFVLMPVCVGGWGDKHAYKPKLPSWRNHFPRGAKEG